MMKHENGSGNPEPFCFLYPPTRAITLVIRPCPLYGGAMGHLAHFYASRRKLGVQFDTRIVGDIHPHVHVWTATEVPNKTWPLQTPIVPNLVVPHIFVGIERQ